MSDRQELLDQANELGLEFPANIPTKKLQGMIEEAVGDGTPPPVEDDTPAPNPAVKAEEPVEETNTSAGIPDVLKNSKDKAVQKRIKVKKLRDQAFKTRIVTITNKDNRENDIMTTAYLSFENQYFGLSKLVPLDVPVELEEALIRIAESTMMTLHKDEIVDGKRTGNKIATSVKKFAVSYDQRKPQ